MQKYEKKLNGAQLFASLLRQTAKETPKNANVMKRIILFSALCTLLMTSCIDLNMNYGNGRKIKPSTTIVKNEYGQQPFDKVDIGVVANVKFIQTDNQSRVVLSCPDNYVNLFKFENKGGELEVEFARDNVNIDPAKVDIAIYSPRLRSLENSGMASVEIDRLKTDRLELENSGVGKLYLLGLQVGRLEVECSGVGGIELGGQADEALLECSGVGSIKAGSLKAKTVRANVSGVGGIHCFASEHIEGNVSGVGSLKYGGNPQKKDLNRSGVGNISEI